MTWYFLKLELLSRPRLSKREEENQPVEAERQLLTQAYAYEDDGCSFLLNKSLAGSPDAKFSV